MCTATYLPFSPTGFILTHSRDEKAIRPAAHPPRTVDINGRVVTFPQDPQGQGTWIAASPQTTICLLNGAFVPHQPQPSYRQSRGLVTLDVFRYPSIDAFASAYNFCGIEPFTLLMIEENRLLELRWNGKRLFEHEKDPHRPHIWSSVTLYAPNVIEKRESWFRDWCRQHPEPSVDAIRQFHQSAGDGDTENSLRMNRQNTLLTLSLTTVVHDPAETGMLYEDFTQHLVHQQAIRQPYAIH